ncbi:FtsX-like permease family protein [Streptomyces sp. NPDC051362]|uniref:FtsX-like permease family protein n=1 Tax=Streptomyces sp. NPDC051362 TaxID=3365651 RepID=UPI0037A6520C
MGLRRTVTSGRMIAERDKPYVVPPSKSPQGQREAHIAVALSSHALTAGRINATVERLDTGDPATLPSRLGSPTANTFVKNLRGTAVGHVSVELGQGYRKAVPRFGVDATNYWTVGPVTYRRTAGGSLAAVPQAPQKPSLWVTNLNEQPVANVPEENTGPQYRKVTSHASTFCDGMGRCQELDVGRLEAPYFDVVGRFDTSRLPGFSPLSQAPLETYQSPQVTGEDRPTGTALNGRPLRPDRNLGGYLTPPPTMLTTMDSVTALTRSRRVPSLHDKAPVSAIRLKVAGVTGVDAASRARVNAVAGQIRTTYPRLQVDVTVGSSPRPQTVVLSDTARVTERRVEKGVALQILRAVDTKSVILFTLVLVVCALFLGQAALASVRSRRTEIGTLRCVGWSGGEVLRLVLGELAAIGLAAGFVGAMLAYGLGRLLGQPDAGAKSLMVVPVALLLATAPGLIPAWLATRLGPVQAVQAPVTAVRRSRPVRSVAGLALVNLLRVRGRTLLGASGLALGVAVFTTLLALTLAFRGEVAGSLLGNAVVAQARTAGYLSVALSLALDAAGAVDVLVLSQRERAADLAILRATGWTNRELARLTLYEGIGLALLGQLVGRRHRSGCGHDTGARRAGGALRRDRRRRAAGRNGRHRAGGRRSDGARPKARADCPRPPAGRRLNREVPALPMARVGPPGTVRRCAVARTRSWPYPTRSAALVSFGRAVWSSLPRRPHGSDTTPLFSRRGRTVSKCSGCGPTTSSGWLPACRRHWTVWPRGCGWTSDGVGRTSARWLRRCSASRRSTLRSADWRAALAPMSSSGLATPRRTSMRPSASCSMPSVLAKKPSPSVAISKPASLTCGANLRTET